MRPGIASLEPFPLNGASAQSGRIFLRGAMKNKPSENAPVAVTRAYDFVLWLVQKAESFSRFHGSA
jgi:hypothetical protein